MKNMMLLLALCGTVSSIVVANEEVATVEQIVIEEAAQTPDAVVAQVVAQIAEEGAPIIVTGEEEVAQDPAELV
jgi:hypothetical protein